MQDDEILSILQEHSQLTELLCKEARRCTEQCDLTPEELREMDDHVWERLQKILRQY